MMLNLPCIALTTLHTQPCLVTPGLSNTVAQEHLGLITPGLSQLVINYKHMHMIGTSDQVCWLAEACGVLSLYLHYCAIMTQQCCSEHEQQDDNSTVTTIGLRVGWTCCVCSHSEKACRASSCKPLGTRPSILNIELQSIQTTAKGDDCLSSLASEFCPWPVAQWCQHAHWFWHVDDRGDACSAPALPYLCSASAEVQGDRGFRPLCHGGAGQLLEQLPQLFFLLASLLLTLSSELLRCKPGSLLSLHYIFYY